MIDKFLSDPNTYLADVEGHRVLVVKTPGGKGYCPADLLAEGKVQQAAQLAKTCWKRKI